jgi:hypothetical protein
MENNRLVASILKYGVYRYSGHWRESIIGESGEMGIQISLSADGKVMEIILRQSIRRTFPGYEQSTSSFKYQLAVCGRSVRLSSISLANS